MARLKPDELECIDQLQGQMHQLDATISGIAMQTGTDHAMLEAGRQRVMSGFAALVLAVGRNLH